MSVFIMTTHRNPVYAYTRDFQLDLNLYTDDVLSSIDKWGNFWEVLSDGWHDFEVLLQNYLLANFFFKPVVNTKHH